MMASHFAVIFAVMYRDNSSGCSAVAPPPATAWLHEGINLVLSQWFYLQFILSQSSGDVESRQLAFANDLFTFLSQSKEKPSNYDVEDYVESILDDAKDSDQFEFDDERKEIEQVARDLMLVHKGCMEGDFAFVQGLKAKQPPANSFQQASSDNDDDEDCGNDAFSESSMMVVDGAECVYSECSRADMVTDESKPQPAEAKDGWTVVSSKRNNGRRRN